MTYLDELLNRPDVQLTFDALDRKATLSPCPLCEGELVLWYVTALNSDGDYLESLTAHKCRRCEYEKFFVGPDEG